MAGKRLVGSFDTATLYNNTNIFLQEQLGLLNIWNPDSECNFEKPL